MTCCWDSELVLQNVTVELDKSPSSQPSISPTLSAFSAHNRMIKGSVIVCYIFIYGMFMSLFAKYY